MPVTTAYQSPARAKGTHVGHMPIRVNLAGWWRFRTAMTSVDGYCSRWEDQSGNGRHLLQATAASRPSVRSNGALVFDGTDDYLQATFTLVQPFTLYFTGRQVTWTSGDVLFDGVTGTAKLAQTTSSPGLAMDAGSALTVDNTDTLLASAVFACVFNSTSSAYQVGAGAATVTTTGDASTGNPGGLTVGASRTPSAYANILVREIALFSEAHSADQRLQMLRYMARIGNVGGV